MQRGKLVEWNDDRGFGFIRGSNGTRYFVHISSIGRIATRPAVGDAVSFLVGTGRDGRPEAQSVSILGANPRGTASQLRGGTTQPSRIDWRLWFAGLLLILIALGLALGRMPWILPLLYLAVGCFSLLAYDFDKRAAQAGRWRISEATLLGLDLCFGIIGGVTAQAVFRHKTRKSGYVATTVLLSVVHLMWLGGFALGLIPVDVLAAVSRALA